MENKEEIKKLGLEIKSMANRMFEQQNKPLEYKGVMPHFSKRSERLGLSLSLFADELEKLGLIKIILSPSNKRWIFSADSKLSFDQMFQIVLDEENKSQLEKDLKKLQA